MLVKWNITKNYLEGTTTNFKFMDKIASFDLDNTIIKTKSNKKFPIDEHDWIFMYDNVQDKLTDLIKRKYCVIIISNQSGLNNISKQNIWMKKLDNIVLKLNIDIKILCAIKKDKYRKPCDAFVTEFFSDSKKSFYCGDAVGRQHDFSDTDYKFALNAKLNCKIPENFFLNEPNNLSEIKYCIDINKKYVNINPKIQFNNNEIIIMVGYPGSGKSTIAKFLQDTYNYHIINQDTLKSKSKCVKECIDFIKNKKSIIIDSTNPSKEKRKQWIDIAKNNNYTTRIIKMTTSMEHSKHNNMYRSIVNNIDCIPDIAYNIYKLKYEEPELLEGIVEIIEQNPGYPDDLKYYKYYV